MNQIWPFCLLLFLVACGDSEAPSQSRPVESWDYGECFRVTIYLPNSGADRESILDLIPHCFRYEVEASVFRCISTDVESLLVSMPPQAHLIELAWWDCSGRYIN
jgi:hypothetical protein